MLPFRHGASAYWTRFFRRLDDERQPRNGKPRVFGFPRTMRPTRPALTSGTPFAIKMIGRL
jgi:hypothetical protein